MYSKLSTYCDETWVSIGIIDQSKNHTLIRHDYSCPPQHGDCGLHGGVPWDPQEHKMGIPRGLQGQVSDMYEETW